MKLENLRNPFKGLPWPCHTSSSWRRLNNAPNLQLNFGKEKLAWPFSKGSLDLWPQDMWMKMGSMGTHESPLYRHAHFMIITCSLGQVIVKSAHWHTDSCCCLLGCSLPCYDLSIFLMLNAVPERVSGQYLSLFCVVIWFPIITI